MRFERATLETCGNATDIAVVIDVLRAFSAAAYAFGAGAQSILLVGKVEDALVLKMRDPSVLLMGEVGGLAIEGFDFGNSPTELAKQNLQGCQLVQRTSAGTQGVMKSINAKVILAGSLCCAGATARFLDRFPGHTVTFVITGLTPDGKGDEDDACADYIESLVKGENPSMEPYVHRVRNSKNARKFIASNEPAFPVTDLDYAVSVNKFGFAMLVERQNGYCVMKPVIL